MGYLRLPEGAKTVVIRMHGLAGSAAGNTELVAAESDAYAEASIGYMLVNGSGTDTQSEAEVFEDSLTKIHAAIAAVSDHCPDVEQVVLEGFSLGASKVAAYILNFMSARSELPIAAVILESWTNVPIWMRSQEDFYAIHQAALAAVEAGRGGEQIVENWGIFGLAYTADAFLSACDGIVNVYPRHDEIYLPTLVIVSPTDEHVMIGYDHGDVAGYLAQFAGNRAITGEVVPGGHAFEGHERKVGKIAAAFVRGVVQDRS